MAFTQADYDRLAGMMGSVTDKNKSANIMLYGKYGSTKSVLAAQVLSALITDPNMGILHIDTGGGWVSLDNHPEVRARVQSQPFTTIEDIELITEMILNKVGVYGYFGGIILDEASSMAQIDVDRIYEARPAVNARGVAKDLSPERPDYNAGLGRFRRMLAKIIDVQDLHLVLVAHEISIKDASGAVTKEATASFSPKTSEKVHQPMHIVGRVTSRSVKKGDGSVEYTRSIQIHPTSGVDAKTRAPFNAVSMPTSEFPTFVADWLKTGGSEVDSETVIPEIEEEETRTPEEIMNEVDKTFVEAAEAVENDNGSPEKSILDDEEDFSPLPV